VRRALGIEGGGRVESSIINNCDLVSGVIDSARARDRVPVAVVHYGDDQVGQQVVFALEAAILESDSFRLVNDEPVPSFPRIVVYLVSVNTGTEFASAISETFVYDSRWLAGNRIYIAASITACGLNWVVLCAETILSYIDDAVKYLRRKSPDLWRSLTTESNYSKQQIPNDSLSSDALTHFVPEANR
jgi:hypothetical protein